MRNLEEDKKLCEEASAGPWKWSDGNEKYDEVGLILDGHDIPICDFGASAEYYPTEGTPPNYENERFITQSREALPYWIAQYEAEHTARLAAEQRVRELELALTAASVYVKYIQPIEGAEES